MDSPKRDDSGPAFPIEATGGIAWEGMSKREYFAAKALQGLLGNVRGLNRDGSNLDVIIDYAVLAADKLIAALNR